jgi:hypothetical protein
MDLVGSKENKKRGRDEKGQKGQKRVKKEQKGQMSRIYCKAPTSLNFMLGVQFFNLAFLVFFGTDCSFWVFLLFYIKTSQAYMTYMACERTRAMNFCWLLEDFKTF